MAQNPPWSKEEDSLLAVLSKQALSDSQIADSLPGRTPSAVVNRRRFLGIAKPRAREIRAKTIVKHRDPNLVDRVCVVCGSDFVGARNAVTCGVDCRRKRSTHLENGYIALKRPILVKSCIVCGKAFKTAKSHKQTCSKACSKINNHRNKEPLQLKPSEMSQDQIRRVFANGRINPPEVQKRYFPKPIEDLEPKGRSGLQWERIDSEHVSINGTKLSKRQLLDILANM